MVNLPSIKTVLVSNAMFSGVGGAALLVAPKALANFFGTIPLWVSVAMGVGLVLFSIGVFWTALDQKRIRQHLNIIFSADCAWVVLTPIAIILFNQRLSFWGTMLLVEIAFIVAIFSFLERQHIKLFEENGWPSR